MNMIERISRAIREVELEFNAEPLSMNATRDDIERIAATAIKEMRDPTPGMVEAGKRMAGEDAIIVGAWQAMIDAALIDASPIDTYEMEPIDTSFGVGEG